MAAKNITKLGTRLRELRIHLCQTSPSSAGVRTFIEENYVALKQENPGFPILIRECSGVEPRIIGRYNKGIESSIQLSGADAAKVATSIEALSTNDF